MAYRSRTFVSFVAEDIASYALMRSWRESERIEFDFHDAQDLGDALAPNGSGPIADRLRERLEDTKQVVLLVGEQTRSAAMAPSRLFHHEVEAIRKLALPVVFANLNGSRNVQRERLPRSLTDQYTICVSFEPKMIKYALDDFVDEDARTRATKSGPHTYKEHVYVRRLL